MNDGHVYFIMFMLSKILTQFLQTKIFIPPCCGMGQGVSVMTCYYHLANTISVVNLQHVQHEMCKVQNELLPLRSLCML